MKTNAGSKSTTATRMQYAQTLRAPLPALAKKATTIPALTVYDLEETAQVVFKHCHYGSSSNEYS